MDKKAMLKQAASALREQKKTIEELQEKIARAEKAEAIVKKLVDYDELLADQVLNKLSELRTKPMEELEVMEKAAEMFHSNFTSSFGKLGDSLDMTGSNPLVEFLLGES